MPIPNDNNDLLVFLDRDGVITVEDSEFIKTLQEVAYIPGALYALNLLHQAGAHIALVSNQSAVGRGLMTMDDLKAVHNRILEDIQSAGGDITVSRYCPHRPDEDCPCRKPKPAMLQEILNLLESEIGIVPKRKYMIGDSEKDIIAGTAVGALPIVVLSGILKQQDIKNMEVKPQQVFPDLLWAVRWILTQDRQ
jgi:D-glycero-D-manno-heptose 1,7-bisphosphate phosphatase